MNKIYCKFFFSFTRLHSTYFFHCCYLLASSSESSFCMNLEHLWLSLLEFQNSSDLSRRFYLKYWDFTRFNLIWEKWQFDFQMRTFSYQGFNLKCLVEFDLFERLTHYFELWMFSLVIQNYYFVNLFIIFLLSI